MSNWIDEIQCVAERKRHTNGSTFESTIAKDKELIKQILTITFIPIQRVHSFLERHSTFQY